jgi:hypothetical protein
MLLPLLLIGLVILVLVVVVMLVVVVFPTMLNTPRYQECKIVNRHLDSPITVVPGVLCGGGSLTKRDFA